MDDQMRDGWAAQLNALLDVARLIAFPVGSTLLAGVPSVRIAQGDLTNEEIAQAAAAGREGRRLVAALTEPRRRVVGRCPVQHSGGGRSRELFAVHDQRLVVAQVARPPAQPSGWRPRRYLLVDLSLLDDEDSSGLAVDCGLCHQTHLFDRTELLSVTAQIEPARSGDGPPPDNYPDVEQAAFAELWGHLSVDALAEPEPALYLLATPERERTYRERFADNPVALGHLSIVAGYQIRSAFGRGSLIATPAPDDRARRITEPTQPTRDLPQPP